MHFIRGIGKHIFTNMLQIKNRVTSFSEGSCCILIENIAEEKDATEKTKILKPNRRNYI